MAGNQALVEHANYDTLFGLVERFSPSGAEGTAVAWLVERMQALGYQQAFVDQAGNAVGMMGDGPKQVILLGHIDTVSGEIPVRVRSGTLFGRGSVDAKGSLAVFVDAVARLGIVNGWQFVVIGAVDEERASLGAHHVATCYKPDFAIIGEPSHWERVTIGYKGSAWTKLFVQRPCTHSASSKQNASEAAVALWGTVNQWAADFNRRRTRLFDQVMPVLRSMASGDDGFEEWARLEINARLPLDLSPDEWHHHLYRLAAEVTGTVIEPAGLDIPAYLAPKNTPLVRAMLAGIRGEGGKPGFVLKTGTADLNIVAPVWKCPAVAYGPGDSALDHGPNEHLSLEEFSRAIAVMETALRTLVK